MAQELHAPIFVSLGNSPTFPLAIKLPFFTSYILNDYFHIISKRTTNLLYSKISLHYHMKTSYLFDYFLLNLIKRLNIGHLLWYSILCMTVNLLKCHILNNCWEVLWDLNKLKSVEWWMCSVAWMTFKWAEKPYTSMAAVAKPHWNYPKE